MVQWYQYTVRLSMKENTSSRNGKNNVREISRQEDGGRSQRALFELYAALLTKWGAYKVFKKKSALIRLEFRYL